MKTLKSIIRREGGFTLTELAVAMLVVGILSSIAVPSFLGARNNAYDKEAQSSIDATLAAAQQHYAMYGDFSDSMTATCAITTGTQLPADLQKLDPNIDMIAATSPSTGPRVVSIQSGVTYNSNNESLGCQAFYATSLSRSGTCWVARLTIEGKYLGLTSTAPIVVRADKNTEAASLTLLTGTAGELNGVAYASFKPQSAGSDAALLATASLANAKLACSGLMQGAASTTGTNVILSSEYYSSWRSAINTAISGSN